jgi:hypothetical protein
VSAPAPGSPAVPEELLGDGTPGGRAARRRVLEVAVACIYRVAAERMGPYSGASPDDLEQLVAATDPLPAEGIGPAAALEGLGALALPAKRAALLLRERVEVGEAAR